MKCGKCRKKVRVKVLVDPIAYFCKKHYLEWAEENMPKDTTNKEK